MMLGLALALFVALLLLARPALEHARAAAMLLRFEGAEPSGIAALGYHAYSEDELSLSTGPARLYRPACAPRGALVLIPGVHHLGIAEPRLIRLAQAISSAGFEVMTPEVSELSSYRVSPRALQTVRQATEEYALARGTKVGLMGISFAGGLSLVAAADPALGRHLTFVAAVGAHHNLRRVADFFSGSEVSGPAGDVALVEPHPYGLGVFYYAYGEALFGDQAEQAMPVLQAALQEDFEEARRLSKPLLPHFADSLRALIAPTPEQRVTYGNHLRKVLVMKEGELAAVSPDGQLASLAVPTYLLHGKADAVVPSTETLWLAREVPSAALKQAVISSVLQHAEYDRPPTVKERWALVHFMASLLKDASH